MPNTLHLTADAVQFHCRHIRPDGRRCGSPALRTRHFCYHHDLTRRSGPRQPQVNSAQAAKSNTFDLPSPADLSERAGLQLAIARILHKIAHNEIDPRRAGLLLYGLQIAATVLPKADTPPRPTLLVDQVLEDPELGTVATESEWAEIVEEDDDPALKTLNGWLQQVRAPETQTIQAEATATQQRPPDLSRTTENATLAPKPDAAPRHPRHLNRAQRRALAQNRKARRCRHVLRDGGEPTSAPPSHPTGHR